MTKPPEQADSVIHLLHYWADDDTETELIAAGPDLERVKAFAEEHAGHPLDWGTNLEGEVCGDDGSDEPEGGYYIGKVKGIA